MLKNLSPETKELICREFIRHESSVLVADEHTSISYVEAGVVMWVTPSGKGKLKLGIIDNKNKNTTESPASIVKFTDGEHMVLFTHDAFCTDSQTVFRATVAHEVGHFLSGHTEKRITDIPNLYQEENRQALKTGDQEKHMYLGTMAVIDGGTLEVELEADLVACDFVGIAAVSSVHILDAVTHTNPLVRLEKFNRICQLVKMLGSGYEGNPAFELMIQFNIGYSAT